MKVKRIGLISSVAFLLASSISFFAQPARMSRMHYEWSWKTDDGKTLTVAKTDLYWGKDDGTFPKHMIRAVTLFKDQAGHHWIVESRYLDSPERFVLTLRLKDTGEEVTISMHGQGGKSTYTIAMCGEEYQVAKGQQGAASSKTHRKAFHEKLSPAFWASFAGVEPWIEQGYLGANCLDFLGYALDMAQDARPESAFSNAVLQPMRPAPVDCSFDAAFGFPCSPAESPRDVRGMVYESRVSAENP